MKRIGNYRRHGRRETLEYKSWTSMIQRCTNPTDINYPRYGGRGIAVCDKWRNSFTNFFADMGVRPSQKHSIDRIDNAKDYEPGNCRWATRSMQAGNRRSSRFITVFGETRILEDWARQYGIDHSTIIRRIDYYGWPKEKAVTTPVKGAL